jgi:hypothetical protein
MIARAWRGMSCPHAMSMSHPIPSMPTSTYTRNKCTHSQTNQSFADACKQNDKRGATNAYATSNPYPNIYPLPIFLTLGVLVLLQHIFEMRC